MPRPWILSIANEGWSGCPGQIKKRTPIQNSGRYDCRIDRPCPIWSRSLDRPDQRRNPVKMLSMLTKISAAIGSMAGKAFFFAD